MAVSVDLAEVARQGLRRQVAQGDPGRLTGGTGRGHRRRRRTSRRGVQHQDRAPARVQQVLRGAAALVELDPRADSFAEQTQNCRETGWAGFVSARAGDSLAQGTQRPAKLAARRSMKDCTPSAASAVREQLGNHGPQPGDRRGVPFAVRSVRRGEVARTPSGAARSAMVCAISGRPGDGRIGIRRDLLDQPDAVRLGQRRTHHR